MPADTEVCLEWTSQISQPHLQPARKSRRWAASFSTSSCFRCSRWPTRPPLAAVTVMLLLPNPKRLMVGYLLGAYTTSITLGLVVIVLSLHNSSTESTSKNKVKPVEDIVVGLLALAIVIVLRTGRDHRFESADARRRTPSAGQEQAGKPTESCRCGSGKGDPKVTFVVGAILSFPGVSYLDALDHIHKLNPGTVRPCRWSCSSVPCSRSCSRYSCLATRCSHQTPRRTG